MLIFSTKMYVKDDFDNSLFIQMVLEWAGKSPNYSFGELVWDNKENEYVRESKDGAQKLSIMQYDEIVAVDLVNKEGKIIWTNDYVLTVRNGKRLLSVQLYRDAEDISAKLPATFNRPRLLKTIINKGYGEYDDDLPTNDECLFIDEDNIGIIEKIILNNKEYMMPIVYITPTLYTSTFKLDCNELAKDLAGVAHVLVEKDYQITNKLRELTDGKNPYNSGVQIYFGQGVSQRILPDKFRNKYDFRKEVSYAVFRKLILGKIDDDLSWTKIRLKKIIESNTHNEDLFKVYDEYLCEKDNEIEACNNRIQELENIISKNEAKIFFLEQKHNKINAGERNRTGAIIFSQECDFFEDEQKDLIIKVVSKELNSMKYDKNQRETRKYHILSSIIQQNTITDASNEMIKQIRNTFSSSFKMNNVTKRKLLELGFDIQDGPHYKLIYRNDNRYQFTVSKTPSDGRSNMNLRGEIIRVLFDVTD